MNVTAEKKLQSQTLLTVELSVEEMKSYLERAASKISEHMKIEGFRPGHAPYEMVKQRAGEMAIYEAAADAAVRAVYPKILDEQKLNAIGAADINIKKLVPGNPFIFTALVSTMPTVTLGDYASVKVEAKDVAVSDAEVDKVVTDLRKMQKREAVVARPATKEDKVVVDLEMFLDRVPLDGGQAKNHGVYLYEPYYVPGFSEQLIGVKKGDVKEFELEFPKDNHQKNLSGKKVKFRVTVHDVFEVTIPEADDAFAGLLGQKNISDLRNLLRENLQNEANNKERDRQDISMLKEIAKRSTFDEIPSVMLTAEVQRMMAELEQNVVERGAEFDKYLESIKKTREQMTLDFAPQAIERVKTALVIRAVAEAEKIEATPEEIEKETILGERMYKDDEETRKHLRTKDGQEHIRGVVRNRKAIERLRVRNLPPPAGGVPLAAGEL